MCTYLLVEYLGLVKIKFIPLLLDFLELFFATLDAV